MTNNENNEYIYIANIIIIYNKSLLYIATDFSGVYILRWS